MHQSAKTTTVKDRTLVASGPFPILQLPLELRRQIYYQALSQSRDPPTKAIYSRDLPDDWTGSPSPLIIVSKQIRAEVFDLLQDQPIGLRITHQGIHYSFVAETSLIAQKLSRYISKLPRLFILIWPPHPDHPTQVIAIWRHLRRLRAELRRVPQLQQLAFIFAETDGSRLSVNALRSRSIELIFNRDPK